MKGLVRRVAFCGATFAGAGLVNGCTRDLCNPADPSNACALEWNLLRALVVGGVSGPTCSTYSAGRLMGLNGVEPNGGASGPAMSADGRYVAFSSSADNLVSGDTNVLEDVFIQDRLTGTIQRVSVSSAGVQATGGQSTAAAVSSDGRYVAYSSGATNLVAGDGNMTTDIFRFDRQTGQTVRVSVATGGAEATGGGSASPAISADGDRIAFHSASDTLVGGDLNMTQDVFVHIVSTNTTLRMSVDSSGTEGAGPSNTAAISADGRFVAYHSTAANLVGGDGNGQQDVFLRDILNSQTTRVSLANGGGEGNGASQNPRLSKDARYVVFQSAADNLVSGDTNAQVDIFLHDRQTLSTTRLSVATGGVQATGAQSSFPTLSADGRYSAFLSLAGNLVPGDTNGFNDVFVHDALTGTTTRVILANGNQPDNNSFQPALALDCPTPAFSSIAGNLVSGDANGVADIFVGDRLP